MRWSRFIISIVMSMQTVGLMAEDSIKVAADGSSDYERRVELRQRRWASLIPNLFVVQNAGNMGVLSIGTGWSYGHHHWETQLLWGYIPKHESSRGKLTMTLKQNYIPWNIPFSQSKNSSVADIAKGWSFSPITASIYLNTVFGHEFWKSQPGRYPDKYYEFMSTKFRLNVALGQRITFEIPRNRRKYAKNITLFYEISSCDLYIRSKFLDDSIPLKDIVGLSIGVKLQTL